MRIHWQNVNETEKLTRHVEMQQTEGIIFEASEWMRRFEHEQVQKGFQ